MSSKSSNLPATTTTLRWICFGVLLLVYAGLYFSEDPSRLGVFNLLLIPDEVVRLWTSGGSVLRGISERIVPSLAACLWLFTSWSAGVLVMRVFAVPTNPSLSTWERRLFETVLGLAATSHLVLAFGLAGLLNTLLLSAVIGILVITGVTLDRRTQRVSATPQDHTTVVDGFWRKWSLGLLGPMVVLLWLGACMPPWEFDVKSYHLQVPKEWHLAGSISFMPHNVYGNMPLGAEMHSLATMSLVPTSPTWFYGAIAGKVVLASFVLLTAAGLWFAGRRWLSPSAGWLSALVLLTTPWVFENGTIGHNEMALACYSFFAWYAVAIWTEQTVDAGQRSWIMAAGFLAGGAAACKYTGVVFVAIPLFLVVVVWRGRFHGRAAMLMALSGLAAGGLWYAKNFAHTGNPVYPLAYSVFGGEGWSDSQAERWRNAHYAHGHNLNQLIDSVTRVGWRVGGQGLLLMPLALLAVAPWGWPENAPRLRWWLVGMLLLSFLVWWVVTHRLERFLLPSLPWAALLAGGAAAHLDRAGWPRRCLVTILLLSWLYAFLGASVTGDVRYLTSLEALRKDMELKRIHPTHLLINSTDLIPHGKQLLMVGDAQAFNVEEPVLYNSCWDPSPLTQLVKGKTANERRKALQDADISHVFVHWGELQRYRQPGNYGYDPFITRALIEELVEQDVLREVPTPEAQQISSTLYQVLDPIE